MKPNSWMRPSMKIKRKEKLTTTKIHFSCSTHNFLPSRENVHFQTNNFIKFRLQRERECNAVICGEVIVHSDSGMILATIVKENGLTWALFFRQRHAQITANVHVVLYHVMYFWYRAHSLIFAAHFTQKRLKIHSKIQKFKCRRKKHYFEWMSKCVEEFIIHAFHNCCSKCFCTFSWKHRKKTQNPVWKWKDNKSEKKGKHKFVGK